MRWKIPRSKNGGFWWSRSGVFVIRAIIIGRGVAGGKECLLVDFVEAEAGFHYSRAKSDAVGRRQLDGVAVIGRTVVIDVAEATSGVHNDDDAAAARDARTLKVFAGGRVDDQGAVLQIRGFVDVGVDHEVVTAAVQRKCSERNDLAVALISRNQQLSGLVIVGAPPFLDVKRKGHIRVVAVGVKADLAELVGAACE